MKLNFCLLTSLLTAGLLFTATPEAVNAQLTGVDAEEFRKIEQPITTKVAITAAGLGLIGIELWWFLLSSSQFKTQFKQFMQMAASDEKAKAAASSEQPIGLAHAFNQEAHRYCDEIAVKITSVYDGIQMPAGVLATEGRTSPKFSAG
ncbi:MAG: hypothetical protein AAFQ63_15190 [Cyanobacteria bacterium J06621_11]